MFKHLHSVIINSLLVVLLVGMLIMPITAMGLIGFKDPNENENREVLSVQDSQEKCREIESHVDLEMEQEAFQKLMEDIKESTESTEEETLEIEKTETPSTDLE